VQGFVSEADGVGGGEEDDGVADGLGGVVDEAGDEGDGMGGLSKELFFVADSGEAETVGGEVDHLFDLLAE
jgi:hypothetical protein